MVKFCIFASTVLVIIAFINCSLVVDRKCKTNQVISGLEIKYNGDRPMFDFACAYAETVGKPEDMMYTGGNKNFNGFSCSDNAALTGIRVDNRGEVTILGFQCTKLKKVLTGCRKAGYDIALTYYLNIYMQESTAVTATGVIQRTNGGKRLKFVVYYCRLL